jgi:hypothetical protein
MLTNEGIFNAMIGHRKLGKLGKLQHNHFTKWLKTYEDTMTIIFSNLKIKGHYGSYFTNVLCCFFIVEGRNGAVASMYSWGGGGGGGGGGVGQIFPNDEKKFRIFHGIRSHDVGSSFWLGGWKRGPNARGNF